MCYEATVIEPDGAVCLNRKHYCLHRHFNLALLKNYPLWDEIDHSEENNIGLDENSSDYCISDEEEIEVQEKVDVLPINTSIQK